MAQREIIIKKTPQEYDTDDHQADNCYCQLEGPDAGMGKSFFLYFPQVDNLIGGAAIYFYSGIGLVKYFKARGELIGDQIPVDFVVDHIIVAVAYQANRKEFKVFHSSTSSRNPT